MKTGKEDGTPKSNELVQTLRIHEMDDMIRSGRYPNAGDFARYFEVSVRTVSRDLDILRDRYRAPLEFDKKKNGWYYTEPNFFIKYIPISEGELFAIALFEPLMKQYANTPIEEPLRNVFRKIAASMPKQISVDSVFAGNRFTFIPDRLPDIAIDTFRTVTEAAALPRTLEFEYRPLQKTTYMKRRFDPYHILCQKGGWYAVGYCHHTGEIRTFAFSRMRKCRITDTRFTLPQDFDPDRYIDSSVGIWAKEREPETYRMIFTADIGTFAAEQFASAGNGAAAETLEDGSVAVTVTTNQREEMKRFVLGQGATVRVLEPASFVEELKAELEAMKKLY